MSYKFKLDENVPRSALACFAARELDACTVCDQGLQGWDDRDLVPRLVAEGRLLVTLDVRVADIRRFSPGTHAGIVLLRTDDARAEFVVELIESNLDTLCTMALSGVTTIVSPRSIRSRHPAGGGPSV